MSGSQGVGAPSRRFGPRSLRSRLVALFAAGSSVLLLLTSAVLYIGFDIQVDDALNQALRERAMDIGADLREGNPQVRAGDPFAVLLASDGRVIDATSARGPTPVLTPAELEQARRHEVFADRRNVRGLGERTRLLAVPERTSDGGDVIVVVGESLDTVVHARERLGLLLGVISPVLIGLVAFCGWVLAGAALRPVRRLTEQAEALSLRESGQRLREPPGEDEIAHLGRTLNAMLDRIEASLAHERAFVDDASHELRTPLSILRGELELAADRPGDRKAVQQSLRSALQEAEHLGRLTESLLVLARADRGQLSARMQTVELLGAARRAADRYQAMAGPSVEVTGDAVTVGADPSEVDRALDNLIANARRHAAGHVRVTVAAGVTPDGGGVLTVADDGPGFPPDFLPVAFDRFTRADPHRSRDDGGAGLGLAIVAAVAAAHGGWARAENGGPLGGARVDVWFPGPPGTPPDGAERP